MKRLIIAILVIITTAGTASGELTKKDIEEIRVVIKEEMQHVDKRIDQIDKRISELRDDMNKRFEQVDKRFEQMMNFMWILAAIFTGLVTATISFALWDRRTMIKPFERKVEEIENRIKDIDEVKLANLISSFKEVAKIDSNVANILKRFNLL